VEKNWVLKQRADAVEVELRRALAQGGYLLDKVRHEIRIGEASYWCFVLAWFCWRLPRWPPWSRSC
jgi:hypothetical protein